MLSIGIFLIIGSYCSTNLVKNGDFEAYAGVTDKSYVGSMNGFAINQSWGNIPSNLSCWYDKAMSLV